MTELFAGAAAAFGLVGIVYVVTGWQRKRCDSNVNQFSNQFVDMEVRLRVLEQKAGVSLPVKQSPRCTCSLARADEP